MAATAEMLAAQAQGGSAGVQAYLAAQQEIGARQQATIAQMQADAVSRNSGVVGEIGGMASAGSDALLNQLAVLQANAGAEDSARSARMSDYSRQAAMAGGLIPLQAQADASLIRAQGETDLARINAQGRNQLEEQRLTFAQRQAAAEQERRDQIEYIKWQMRADEKKASAEAAAKAAKENTLSADEVEAMAMLAARNAMQKKLTSAEKKLADAPKAPVVKATKQSDGTFIMDPSILKPSQSKPTPGQLKEYEQVTGKKAPANITLAQVRKVIGGVKSPEETRKAQILQRAPQQAVSGQRTRALGETQQARQDYANPLAMRDEVAAQAAALRDQGYIVTPEVMSRLLNQPFLSADQYDLRDVGLPYTDAQMYQAYNRDKAMAEDPPDGYDEARAVLDQAFGYDFDALVASADITPAAAASYITGEQGNIETDLNDLDSFLGGDPDNDEIDAWFRERGVSPAQERILRALKGL